MSYSPRFGVIPPYDAFRPRYVPHRQRQQARMAREEEARQHQFAYSPQFAPPHFPVFPPPCAQTSPHMYGYPGVPYGTPYNVNLPFPGPIIGVGIPPPYRGLSPGPPQYAPSILPFVGEKKKRSHDPWRWNMTHGEVLDNRRGPFQLAGLTATLTVNPLLTGENEGFAPIIADLSRGHQHVTRVSEPRMSLFASERAADITQPAVLPKVMKLEMFADYLDHIITVENVNGVTVGDVLVQIFAVMRAPITIAQMNNLNAEERNIINQGRATNSDITGEYLRKPRIVDGLGHYAMFGGLYSDPEATRHEFGVVNPAMLFLKFKPRGTYLEPDLASFYPVMQYLPFSWRWGARKGDCLLKRLFRAPLFFER